MVHPPFLLPFLQRVVVFPISLPSDCQLFPIYSLPLSSACGIVVCTIIPFIYITILYAFIPEDFFCLTPWKLAVQLGHTGWMRLLLLSFHIYHPTWGDRLDLPLDSASLTSSSALAIKLSYCPHCIRYLSVSSLLSSARIGFVGLSLLWFYLLDICRHCVPDRLTPHWP